VRQAPRCDREARQQRPNEQNALFSTRSRPSHCWYLSILTQSLDYVYGEKKKNGCVSDRVLQWRLFLLHPHKNAGSVWQLRCSPHSVLFSSKTSMSSMGSRSLWICGPRARLGCGVCCEFEPGTCSAGRVWKNRGGGSMHSPPG